MTPICTDCDQPATEQYAADIRDGQLILRPVCARHDRDDVHRVVMDWWWGR